MRRHAFVLAFTLIGPPGYLQGVRDLCDKHGIVMVADEVMAGFGRTGRIFSWCHSDIVPDITTAAKGINGAFLPLGMVGVRDHLAEHFKANPINVGSTYNSHPVVLASALGVIEHMLDTNLVGHVQKMAPIFEARLDKLVKNHKAVKQARAIGLFGCFDIQKNTHGEFIAKVTDPAPPAMVAFRQALLDNGIHVVMRGHHVLCIPPLIITEDEINDSFDRIEAALPVLNDAVTD